LTHLQKVAQTLAPHGYVETARGRSGGIRLARAPETIRIGKVILATEPDFHMAPCTAEQGDCPVDDPCTLLIALGRAVREAP
jgi:Rrf2 family protein